ncbi:hypothetical protein B0A55_04856 [Friedmanniomyces simplex]|uniref:Uncharacterized protein n=1 Tax=Friedmanniomyces simplex TaxID=329884 RepID=A0A4U0XG05_9PEZI|nr:hypothetical protein B0A55_04856 [Friedmanniomyces simplex]
MCGRRILPYRCGHERHEPTLCYPARQDPRPCPGEPDGQRRAPIAEYCCSQECCAQEFDQFYAAWDMSSYTAGYHSDWQERQWRKREAELEALHAGCRQGQMDLYEM